jgi:PEP-CTERM motif
MRLAEGIVFAAILALTSVEPLRAEPITYQLTGVVTAATGPDVMNQWLPGITVGGAVTGVLTFDPLDFTSLSSSCGCEYTPGVLNDFEVTIAGNTFGANGPMLTVRNDNADGDLLNWWSFSPRLLNAPVGPGPFNPDDLVLNLLDTTGTLLSSVDPPMVNLGLFEDRTVVFDGDGYRPDGGADHIVWSADITSVRQVPEPSTVLLIGTGVAVGFAARWGRRHLGAPLRQ